MTDKYLADEIELELAKRLKPFADSYHAKYRRDGKSGHVSLEMPAGRMLEFNVGFSDKYAAHELIGDRFSIVVSDRPNKAARDVKGLVLGTIGKDDLVQDRLRDILRSYFASESF